MRLIRFATELRNGMGEKGAHAARTVFMSQHLATDLICHILLIASTFITTECPLSNRSYAFTVTLVVFSFPIPASESSCQPYSSSFPIPALESSCLPPFSLSILSPLVTGELLPCVRYGSTTNSCTRHGTDGRQRYSRSSWRGHTNSRTTQEPH